MNVLNKELAGLSDGANCVDLAQAAVTAAKAKSDEADKAEQDAQKACADADEAPISWVYTLSQMTPAGIGSLDQFHSNPAYIAAVAHKKTACGAVITATEIAKALRIAHQEAIDAATRARHVCQCKAKHAMETALSAAQSSDAERAKSWTKAHHMACVLEGTPAGQCNVPAAPAVSKPDLHGDVANAVCLGYIAKTVQESGLTCPTSCPISEATLTGKVQCINFSTDAVTSDDECDKVNAKKPDAKTKHCPGMQWGQGHCFLSGPQGNQGCYNIHGGCYEEKREGWDGEEQRECFGNGGLSCYPGAISGNTKYQGCYRSGNGCYPHRL